MKLEDQVASLDLCKRLKELGVKQESLFYWYSNKPDREKDCFVQYEELEDENNHVYPSYKLCAAFTVAELGEMLPPFMTTEKYLCKSSPRFNTHEEITIECRSWHDDKEAAARAKMLCYLIENGLVKIVGEGK